MNRYQPPTPRAAFGLAAAVLTAMTIGLAVVLPAHVDTADRSRPDLAAGAGRPLVDAVSIIPVRIDVLGVREPELASAPVDRADARCGEEG